MSVNTNYEQMVDECIICFDEIKQTDKLLKCKLCKNVVHAKCFYKWQKINHYKINTKKCLHCQRQTKFKYVSSNCLDYLKQCFFRIK